jgi:phage terminase large subunit-like protein
LSVQQEITRLLSSGTGRTLFVEMLPQKLLRDDKLSRLVSVSHLFENEIIFAPDKQFATAVIDQVGNFPFAGHDEYVDCTTMALRWFRDHGFAPTREERFEEGEAEKAFRPKAPPLYGGI